MNAFTINAFVESLTIDQFHEVWNQLYQAACNTHIPEQGDYLMRKANELHNLMEKKHGDLYKMDGKVVELDDNFINPF